MATQKRASSKKASPKSEATTTKRNRGRKPAAQSNSARSATAAAPAALAEGQAASIEQYETAIATVSELVPRLHRGPLKNRVPETLQGFPAMFRTWSSYARKNLKRLQAEQPKTMTAGAATS